MASGEGPESAAVPWMGRVPWAILVAGEEVLNIPPGPSIHVAVCDKPPFLVTLSRCDDGGFFNSGVGTGARPGAVSHAAAM